MSVVAWVVFTAFLGYVIWDGLRRTIGSKTLDDYYAGGRKIPWWAAGLSVAAVLAAKASMPTRKASRVANAVPRPRCEP